jgi:hypothetical protein
MLSAEHWYWQCCSSVGAAVILTVLQLCWAILHSYWQYCSSVEPCCTHTDNTAVLLRDTDSTAALLSIQHWYWQYYISVEYTTLILTVLQFCWVYSTDIDNTAILSSVQEWYWHYCISVEYTALILTMLQFCWAYSTDTDNTTVLLSIQHWYWPYYSSVEYTALILTMLSYWMCSTGIDNFVFLQHMHCSCSKFRRHGDRLHKLRVFTLLPSPSW